MEDPATWRRSVFLSTKLSCLSPLPRQHLRIHSPPKIIKKESNLHKKILTIEIPHLFRTCPISNPLARLSPPDQPPLTSLCALGAAVRVIRHETRYTTGGGGCLQSSTSGSRPGTSAYSRTSSSQSQGTIAARIVERRIQVGPLYFQGTSHPRCMILLLGRWLKDGTKVLTGDCVEFEQSGQAGV